MLKVTFLGTGTSQGVPVIACRCAVCSSTDERDKRLRSSVMIEDENTTLVIDSGPDFRQQMLRVKALKLDGLLFTHEHKDHIAGMDDIRAFNYICKKPVDIYATLQVQAALKREFHYAFDENKYPGVPELILHTIDNSKFKIGTIELQPILVKHYKLDVFGYRVGPFTYITDAKTIDDAELKKIAGTEVLVLNALRKEEHVSHLTLNEAIAISGKINPVKTYFTHISHQLGTTATINRELPTGMELAFDGLVLEF
ncbi:MAG: MBL fold metallo-hydrolase [Bacteroidota bacterium]